MNAKLQEANNLLDRTKRCNWLVMLSEVTLCLTIPNSALYFKDLEDTINISYLLHKMDSILIIQQFNYVKELKKY
jgi:hypothetical protein